MIVIYFNFKNWMSDKATLLRRKIVVVLLCFPIFFYLHSRISLKIVASIMTFYFLSSYAFRIFGLWNEFIMPLWMFWLGSGVTLNVTNHSLQYQTKENFQCVNTLKGKKYEAVNLFTKSVYCGWISLPRKLNLNIWNETTRK